MSRPGSPGPRASFLAIATTGEVVRRALLYAVVVGGVLIGINHGDALLAGDLDRVRLLKMTLTPLVPYVVSTLSSVSAVRSVASRGAFPSP